MDQPLDGRYLGQITEDFAKVAHLLQEAAYQVIRQKVSQYPVFVAAKEPVKVGIELLPPQDHLGNQWHYNASFMEELEGRGLVYGEGKTVFLEHYKNPEEFACLLVVLPTFIKFTFIPYPEEETL